MRIRFRLSAAALPVDFLLFIALGLLFAAGCAIKLVRPEDAERMATPAPTPAAPAVEPDPYTKLQQEFLKGRPLPKPDFELADPGSPDPVDYAKYGSFQGVGTEQYSYEVTDIEGLNKVVGEGLFPNGDGVLDDPAQVALAQTGALDKPHWDSLQMTNLHAAFFIWAQAAEEPGVKAYFTATTLEKAGLIFPAIKAYHSVLVNFPRSACWGAGGTFVWYVAPAALSSIERLCHDYPGLGLWLEGAEWSIQNNGDTDLDNDLVKVNPGRIVKTSFEERLKRLPDLATMEIVEQRGTGLVQAVKFSNGHWQLRVDGKPFVVRGVTYGPTEIGYAPGIDPIFGHRWMLTDKNGNGKSDAAYDAWVDRNGNGQQDADEPAVGDFQLLKDMGCNAIRFYVPTTKSNTYDPADVNKPLLRDLHERYGIWLIAGDFVGAYTVGSGASWEKGTDYTDPGQRSRMKEVVRRKVLDLKDEPFLLMWLLGNENNMNSDHTGINATRTNAGSQPQAYAEFLNELAEMIHELDPNHPVAIGNLHTGLAEYYNRHAPGIDVFGVNAYMGPNGFGGVWNDARRLFDRPVLITEYGRGAYDVGRGEPDETAQAAYHEGCLRDIVLNQAGGELAGNAVGGIVFEYLDEWWKGAGEPDLHQTKPEAKAEGDGHVQEEWFGIVGQGSGRNSPFERNLRAAYRYYRGVWAAP